MGLKETEYVDKEKQRMYAELAYSARGWSDGFIYNLNSCEELLDLIDKFVKASSDGKRFKEEKIVKILLQNNALTGYRDEHGTEKLCINIRNEKKVSEAANEYIKYAKKLPKASEINELFFKQLHGIYKNCKSSVEYLTEFVKVRMKTISPELIQRGDSTRLLIFKQFLKAGEFPKRGCMSLALKDYICEITDISKISTKKEIISAISKIKDDVFEKLKEFPETGRDAQKSFREKWEPLFWANDIANGIFNDQQTTRSKLYWFAIMFEMSYYTGAKQEEPDEKTDIQKNLFYGYYADNLLNTLLNPNMRVEKEPTGHGINFKNFVEVIYLYYIHKKDMTPYQKWISAKKMIDKCKSDDEREIDRQVQRHGGKNTFLYEPLVNHIMKFSEDEFEKFIMTNYICGKKGVNIIRTFSGNMMAATVYKTLVKKLQESSTMMFDYAKISSDRIYSITEATYYLKNKCNDCKEAETERIFEKCPEFKTRCKEKYKMWLDKISAELDENKKAKSFLDECAKCDIAFKERIFEKCSHYEKKCKDCYVEYRTKKLTPYKSRKEVLEVKNAIMKADIMEFLINAGDLFSEMEITVADENFKKLLATVEKKLELLHNKTTVDECIQATFMPEKNVEDYVTRTKMIVIYYYIFIMRNLSDGIEYDSFIDFYYDFCEEFIVETNDSFESGSIECYGINDALVVSGYQEINPDNFFDIILVFLAYRKYRKLYTENNQ